MRHKALYPPFCHMLIIRFKGHNEDEVKKEAEDVKKVLSERYNNEVKMYGPVPAARSKIKENYRYNILLKSKQVRVLSEICNHMQKTCINRHVDIAWDLEPLDLL